MGAEFTMNDGLKQNPFVIPEGYLAAFVVRKKFTLTSELRQLPYTIPEQYFETFEVCKPFVLGAGQKVVPYTVPGNYFDTLQVHIAERTVLSAAHPKVVYWRHLRTQVAVAASVVIMLFTGYGIFSYMSKSQVVTVAEDPMIEIVSTYLPTIDEHTLVQTVLSKEKTTPTTLNNDAIIHYLSNTSLSLNDIAALY